MAYNHNIMNDLPKFLLIIVILGIVAWFFYSTYFLVKQITPLKESWNLYLVQLGLFLIIFAIADFKIHKKLIDFLERRKYRKERIRKEKHQIYRFLYHNDLNYKSDVLRNVIRSMETDNFLEKSVEPFKERLEEKLIKARRLLEKLEHEEEIEYLEARKKEEQEELKEIEKEKHIMQGDKEQIKRDILEYLDIENTKVFEKDELDDEEIEALLEEGFKQVNEFDVVEKRNISVLVKPVLDHSSTHTFLVWSARYLLEQIFDVKDIEEHETRDADITFEYEGETFALEIETGNLLKKRKQLDEKVKYLNRKYKKRWMFIVSKKDLVSKYGKFGFTSPRNQVKKNIKKLLKSNS